ncbi:AsmA-like C-terminal region-containing protein [Aureimonas sp. AU12]|uniref:AsmA-like C-terminal region-containing protein n=1 Tax=Aureimonas sp. AU12 TaxID=1638161 RepID=UPI000782CC36|nr:AsmA-like C-terminal region-containing protein [Aureimonas sp. AU12]
MRRLFRFCGALVSLVLFLSLAAAGAIGFLFGTETGETFVRDQTTAALGRLLGPAYQASLGEQSFEVRRDGTLALNWNGVTLQRKDRPDLRSDVDRVSVALRLLPLVGGSLEFGRLEIEGARIDLAAFSETASERYRRVVAQRANETAPTPSPAVVAADEPVRSRISRTADSAIRTIERQLQALQAYHFDTVSFTDITVEGLPAQFGASSELQLDRAELHRSFDGSLQLSSRFDIGLVPVALAGAAQFDSETSRLLGFSLRSGQIQLEDVLPPAPVTQVLDERPFGSDSDVSFEASMSREEMTGTPVLRAGLHVGEGQLQLGLNHTRIESIALGLEYREGEDRLLLLKSPMRFADVAFDAEGSIEPVVVDGAVDSERLQFRVGAGNAISKVGRRAADEPRTASFWIDGQVNPLARTADLTRLELLPASGRLEGQAAYRAGAPDDVTSLHIAASELAAEDIKAFWPFVISGKARAWVLAHVGDEARIPAGTIDIEVTRDRLGTAFRPDNAPTDRELRLDLALAQADVLTIGTVPRLREANGRLETRGSTTTVFVDSAKVEAHDDVAIGASTVVLGKPAEGHRRDLMIDLTLKASGGLAGVLDVANADPIRALRSLDADPALASGSVDADVTASLRLGEGIAPADQLLGWGVEARLTDGDLGQPIQGRRFTGLDGVVRVIPGQASGDLKGAMDGLPADLMFAIPFGAKPIGDRQIDIALKVPSKKVAELVPALAEVVDGPIAAEVTDGKDGLRAKLQLTDTTLDLPVIAWKKGAGVPATLSFALKQGDDGTMLDDIELRGDGFRADGSVSIDKTGLRRAALRNVAFNPGDDVNVDVTRHGNGYGIDLSGAKFDARPILAELKSTIGQDKTGRVGGGTFDVTADIDQLGGFNGRAIRDFSLNYASAKGQMAALSLAGTAGGGTLSGDLSPRGDSRAIRIASNDAGALLAFTGFYDHMEGGQATLELVGSADAGYGGRLRMANVTLVDEPRLSRIVGSAPDPKSASLSQALGQDLRTERAFFDQASANLNYRGGTLRVADGIVRGPVFGSSFAGTLYDPKSRIDIAGSFMPAYGINRVFGAIPILGQILGNGNEGGLIGITYHLSGPFAAPSLVVNPISAIAPGIFRQIFSYEPAR